MKTEEINELMLKEYPDLLVPADVSKILGTTIKTVYKMIDYGYFYSIKVGRTYRIPKIRFIEYLVGIKAS